MQARFLKHEFLIRGLETVVLAFFLFATLYALFAPPIRDNPRAQVVRPGRPDQRGTQAGRSAKPTTQVLARQEEEARGISQTWALAGVVATVLAAIAATLWQFGARLTQF